MTELLKRLDELAITDLLRSDIEKLILTTCESEQTLEDSLQMFGKGINNGRHL